jgi:hypothetical protein
MNSPNYDLDFVKGKRNVICYGRFYTRTTQCFYLALNMNGLHALTRGVRLEGHMVL